MSKTYSGFTLGDTTASYVQATSLSPLSLWLVPPALPDQVERDPLSQTQSVLLIQVRVRGVEGASRFFQGRSTSFSPSALNLKLEEALDITFRNSIALICNILRS